ncbi:hypothetical protein T492DRAFT_928541 [Pavlovales sp. CCMP2436]|nr:hypothetical protein T492DRAFT_928541 [Pavlovales sp. CCMP2436]
MPPALPNWPYSASNSAFQLRGQRCPCKRRLQTCRRVAQGTNRCAISRTCCSSTAATKGAAKTRLARSCNFIFVGSCSSVLNPQRRSPLPAVWTRAKFAEADAQSIILCTHYHRALASGPRTRSIYRYTPPSKSELVARFPLGRGKSCERDEVVDILRP